MHSLIFHEKLKGRGNSGVGNSIRIPNFKELMWFDKNKVTLS
jgi:hypothetical protein